jgi:hypothetical protein
MKKSFLFGILLLGITFTSCKKDYVCICKDNWQHNRHYHSLREVNLEKATEKCIDNCERAGGYMYLINKTIK